MQLQGYSPWSNGPLSGTSCGLLHASYHFCDLLQPNDRGGLPPAPAGPLGPVAGLHRTTIMQWEDGLPAGCPKLDGAEC